MGVWYEKGVDENGDPFLYEVDEGSPAQEQLVKLGGVQVDGPADAKPAGGRRKADAKPAADGSDEQ